MNDLKDDEAQKFIDLCKAAGESALPDPELSLDSDGELSLDWTHGANAISVSLNANGRYTYAYVVERHAHHGFGLTSNDISEPLKRAFRAFAFRIRMMKGKHE